MSLQQFPGLSRADSYSIQTKELQDYEEDYEERRLLNQSKEIITNYKNYFQENKRRALEDLHRRQKAQLKGKELPNMSEEEKNIILAEHSSELALLQSKLKADEKSLVELVKKLNGEFLDPRSGKKTVDDYKKTLKHANNAKITLDIDGAIVNALAALAIARKFLGIIISSPHSYDTNGVFKNVMIKNFTMNVEKIDNLEKNIDFLTKIPKMMVKEGDRVTKFNNALFKLLEDGLSDEGYNLISNYATSQGILIQVEELKRALKNKQISTPTEFSNKRGGSQNGGMWQQGGFFMTCS